MRRFVRLCLIITVLTVLSCVIAFASDAPTESGVYDLTVSSGFTLNPQTASGTVVEKSGTVEGKDFYPEVERFSLTYNGGTGFQLVLALEDDTVPKTSNIKYIDQTWGGAVTFNIYPSKLQPGKTYNILVVDTGETKQVASFKYYQPYTLGDVDEDGTISVIDALWILQTLADQRMLSVNAQLAANVDGDDAISVIDALWILQVLADLRTF